MDLVDLQVGGEAVRMEEEARLTRIASRARPG